MTGINLQSCRLFYTYEDTSTEYKLQKIKYDESAFDKLVSIWYDDLDEKLTCVGFLGDRTHLSIGCQNFLELTAEQTLSLENLLKEQVLTVSECLLAYRKGNKIAFVYCCNNTIFQEKSLLPNVLAIDYVRYIIDMCEKILVFPPMDLQWDANITNPFQDSANTFVQLQERNVRPNETISVIQLNTNQKLEPTINATVQCSSSCRPYLQFCQDHSRHFVTYHFHEEIDHRIKSVKVSTRDLQNDCYRSVEVSVNYKEATEYLTNKWPTKHIFFATIQHRAIATFKHFIQDDKQEEFEQFLTELSQRYKTIIEAKSLDTNKEFVSKLIQFCREHSCATAALNDGFFSSMVSKGKSILGLSDKSLPKPDPHSDFSKRHKKCSESCTSLDIILKNLERTSTPADQISELINTLTKFSTPEIFAYSIHWIDVDDIRRKAKDSWREHNQRNLLHVYDDHCKEAREFFANELHQWLQLNTCDYDEIHRSEMKLNFFDFNPIMDVEGNISDFKFMKKPVEMTHRLQMTTNEDIKDIRCSQIVFVNDKIGFINITNHPPGRATLFYFNQTDSTYCQMELEQKLASPDARLLIDSNSGVYFIYDNVKQCAERGKLNEHTMRLQSATVVSNLYGNSIDGNDATDVKLQYIITMCFLHGSDSMLLLDKQFNLIEYRYLSGTMKLVHKRINEDTHIKKVPLQSVDGLLYTDVTAAPNGKCILLQCSKSIDIYDLTWTMIGSIPIISIKHFLEYKVFIDQMNTYIAKIEKQIDTNQHICDVYLLRGLSASRTLDIEKASVKNLVGFPFLDIFYLTQRKFGPPSESIGCPRKSTIVFFRPEDFILTEEKLDSYFAQLYVMNMQLAVEPLNEPDYTHIFRRLQTIKVSDFRRIIKTRVPIHIATIEDSNLFPLKDGKNITDEMTAWRNSKENKSSLVQCISEIIRVGPYETLLKNCNQPVKVIAIVGRQSGGKSYLLNRLTGTRFNVAATRCTDGIWMSVAFVQTQPIVVLDCEGLFSTRRNDLEEIKLCLTLSALTDILLLNQDLSFNRYLTQLFSNFSKSCDRMKGSNLFKGFLMMVIRDVSTQDAEGAYTELISNIRQQGSSSKTAYLQKLFGGKIRGQCLHHFENLVFATEIDQMRQLILDLPYRWMNGGEFLDSLKLTLAQVHTDDDTLMDVHRLKMTFNRLEREAHKMLIEGGPLFSSCERLTILLNKLQQEGASEIMINQETINFMRYIYVESTSDQTRDEEDLSRTHLCFHEMLSEHFQCGYHEQYHNLWLSNLNNLFQNVLDHRVKFILQYVHQQMPNESSMLAEILDFESSLKVKLDHLKFSSQLCVRTCRHCQRLCSKIFNHRDDCHCETDHLCKIQCQLCIDTMMNLCCDLYGHDGKHRCNEGHVCGKPCTITKDCKMFCTLDIQHENDDEHDCNNRHYCGEKCSEYPACDKTCASDIKVVHHEHVCNENICPHTCSVSECRRRCTVPVHFHQRFIQVGTTADVMPDYHVCSSTHTCLHQCEQDGVCAIGYNIVEKEWENELNTFPYKFYEPVPSRSKCVRSIPLHADTHSNERHDCKIDHRCGSQCPECRSFCQLPHGHIDPYHSTNTHRNKECNVFVSRRNDDQPLIVRNEGKCREYKAGESCKPEVCSESCERKGRAHFHLKLCPDEENCAANLYPYVKHSTDRWYPFVDHQYDLWLCEAYWHSLGWDVPYNDDIRAIINKCSFVCLHSNHGENEQSFCSKNAWHTGEHAFDCMHETFNKLDIVFCCDTTGSMSSYINESKDTIRRIIQASTAIKDVKFRFVAYRDHPPEDESYVTKSNAENLTNATNIIRFIETLDASGGGDGPEAVLDGLHDAVMNTMWREAGTLKYIIHIADSPPHGHLYGAGTDDHWPGGCPCGKTIEHISSRLNEKNIRYKLMKIGSYPNAMSATFRSFITYFEESDLDGALDLSTKFIGILSRDLQAEEIDVIVD